MPTETTRHELIFDHAGNARVAASVTLAGIIAVLFGGVFMAIGPRLPQDTARSGTSAESNTVRVIGTPPPQSVPCGEQVWPNIDQRCLVRTNAGTAAAPENPAARQAVKQAPKEDVKLTPLTATGEAVVGKEVTPQDEAIAARQAAPPPRRETSNWQARSDEAAQFADEDVDESPPPPPPRRGRRHIRFPFHGHIGPFRF